MTKDLRVLSLVFCLSACGGEPASSQGTNGSSGTNGNSGANGAAGATGPAGANGDNAIVKAANGDQLGIYLDATIAITYHSVAGIPDNRLLYISKMPGMYTTANCTGTVYSNQALFQNELFNIIGMSSVLYTATGTPSTLQIGSESFPAGCTPVNAPLSVVSVTDSTYKYDMANVWPVSVSLQ